MPPTRALRAAPAPNGSDMPMALLVLLPGAMLGPKDYDALFAAVKVRLILVTLGSPGGGQAGLQAGGNRCRHHPWSLVAA